MDEAPEEREQTIEDRADFSRIDDPAPRVSSVERGEDLARAAVREVEEPALIASPTTTAFAKVERAREFTWRRRSQL